MKVHQKTIMEGIAEAEQEKVQPANKTGTERPILFSTPMVQAELEKRKSQTRRTTGLDTVNEDADNWQFLGMELDPKIETDINKFKTLKGYFAVFSNEHEEANLFVKSRYGQPGDLLWVRETTRIGAWREDGRLAFDYLASPELKRTPWGMIDDDPEGEKFMKIVKNISDTLRAKGIKPDSDGNYNWEPGQSPLPWKPSIHMPKAAARIWLKVKEIGVERLQDIKPEDAVAEEILPLAMSSMQLAQSGQLYFDYTKPKQLFNDGLPPFWSFSSLWCSINGADSWDANPWVWVVKFEVLSTTGKPSFDSAQDDKSISLEDAITRDIGAAGTPARDVFDEQVRKEVEDDKE